MSERFVTVTVADATELVNTLHTATTTSGVELAREHGTHYIEESANVYFMRDPAGSNEWVLDPTTVSGEALESTLEHGPEHGNCECGQPTECAQLAARMDRAAALPNADELLVMLAAALGYELHPIS